MVDTSTPENGHLWLIGMMGAGKTTTGRLLAEQVGIRFTDTDDEVARRSQSSVAGLWEAVGEAGFREAESTVVSAIAEGPGAVVATGGGVVLSEGNVAVMRHSGMVVWLSATLDTLAQRVGSGGTRPLIAGEPSPRDKLRTILEERADLYQAASHAVVAIDGLEHATVVDRIEELWNEFT